MIVLMCAKGANKNVLRAMRTAVIAKVKFVDLETPSEEVLFYIHNTAPVASRVVG